MYPHERSLVKQLADQPFALLGVNTDPKERARSAVNREHLNWRFWWDGGSTGGPIARSWNIHGWPTLVLLDHKGVIRQKYLGVQEYATIKEDVLKLLKEVR